MNFYIISLPTFVWLITGTPLSNDAFVSLFFFSDASFYVLHF